MSELQTVRQIADVTRDIRIKTGQFLMDAIDIGRLLYEAKAMVEPGKWSQYIAEELPFSHSWANNYMRLYKELGDNQVSLFGDSQALWNLRPTQALELLALPAEERQEFMEEHDVEHMSTRELHQAIRERDEARQAKEEAEAKAEEAAEKAQREIDRLKEELTDRAVENALKARAEAAESQQKRAEEKAIAAQKTADSLRKQLEAAKKETEKARAEIPPTAAMRRPSPPPRPPPKRRRRSCRSSWRRRKLPPPRQRQKKRRRKPEPGRRWRSWRLPKRHRKSQTRT